MKTSKIIRASFFAIATMPGAFFIALHAQTSVPKPAPPQMPQLHSVWDGVYTDTQAQRGQALYQKLCSSCHGNKLVGKADEDTPALIGHDFEVHWNGHTVADLFKQIVRKMPQDDPGSLTPPQAADLTAFILSFNKFPSGDTDLPANNASLAAIRVLVKKPEQPQGPNQPK